jgi:signal transduction histidine kinase
MPQDRETSDCQPQSECLRTGEDHVRQAQLEAIARLSASLAHDLRNPLGVVRNTAYVLKRKLAQGDVSCANEYIEMIEKEMVVADQIIKDVLAATRCDAPRRRSVALAQLVADARRHFADHEGVEWCASMADTAIDVDAEQFTMVFRHLFHNAIQAMRGQGRITVSVKPAPDGDEIAVEDTGPGIPPENLERVFEPLYSGRSRGLGLGLTVCRRIVEAHDGTLAAIDRTGGAMLLIRLPCPKL